MQIKPLCISIHIIIKGKVGTLNMFKPSSNFFTDCLLALLLLWIIFVICVHFCLYYAVLSIPCSLGITCLERADLKALLYMMFSCGFVTFPYGVSVQVWYLIELITDLCLLYIN